MQSSRAQMGRMMDVIQNRVVVWGGLYAVVLTAFVASITWGFDETEPAEVGLRGLISAETPDDLSEEEWQELAGNWKQWSIDAAAEVQKFYEAEDLDLAGQREVIANLNSKLDVMKRALADRRYQSIFDELVTLYGRLSRRVAMAEAALDTLQLDAKSVKAARIESAGTNLAKAVDKLRAYLKPIEGGTAWLPYIQAEKLTKQTAPGQSPDKAIGLLEGVQKKFQAKDKLGDQQRKFISRAQFAAVEAAIGTYLNVAKQKPKTVDVRKLRDELTALFEALQEYEETNSRVAAANAGQALEAIRGLSLDDGERIDAALSSHYVNFNLRVVASEDFLNRLLGEERTEQGEVRDYILQADVYGEQTTTATAGVDVKQSDNGALFDVTLTGVVRSDTQGVTSQATVYNQGTHYISATKEVSFDGERFTTKPAKISVDANIRTVDARTGISGFPILGWIADDYAMKVARGKRGQSEAIAVGRVEDKVLPKFNKEVDDEFNKINDQLENDVRKRLRKNKLLPQANGASSTDTHLMLNSRVVAKAELGGSAPGSTPVVADAPLLIHLHESLLNNAVDRMELAGKTLTDEQVARKIEKFLSSLLGREFKLDKYKKEGEPKVKKGEGPDTFVFDKDDPVRFRAEGGSLSLVIRAGFKQKGKEDIPAQEVVVPLTFRVEGEEVVIERGKVKVKPVKRPKSIPKQVARAGAIIKKISSALPTRRLDGNMTLQREGKSDFVIALTDIKALNGWLTLAFK